MNIFKMTMVVVSMMAVLNSPMVNAKDGQGTVEEIVYCDTGLASWKRYLLFKLTDGNWFGVHAKHMGSPIDYDNNFAVSMVMMAFSSKLPVSVSFNHSVETFCGVTANFQWDNGGDYIKIAR